MGASYSMRSANAKTRFPFPPIVERPFPDELVLYEHLAELSGWWLAVRCDCEGRDVCYLPLRLLAADHGWQVKLETVAGRLRCQRCGGAPASIELVEDAAGSSGRHNTREPKRLTVSLGAHSGHSGLVGRPAAG